MTLINYLLLCKKIEVTNTALCVGLVNTVNSHSYRKCRYFGCCLTEIKLEVQPLQKRQSSPSACAGT